MNLLSWFFILPALHAQTDSRLWRFVDPNAKAVIGIDWKRTQQSPAGAMLQQKLGADIFQAPGVEFLKDVERVLISSPGRESLEDASEPPMLIAIRGHFNLSDLRKALVDHGAKRQMYGTIPIYRPSGKNGQDLGFVLLDAQTVLIGDIGSICSSLGRTEFTPREANATLTRAAALDAAYDVWAVNSSTGALASTRMMGMFTGEEFGDAATAFEAGLSFRDGLSMNVSVNTRAEAAAKLLSSRISKVLKLAAKDKPTNPALAEFERKMKVSYANMLISITLRLTQDELEKNARLFARTVKKMEPEKMVVIIEGLDGGMKEIPYKPR